MFPVPGLSFSANPSHYQCVIASGHKELRFNETFKGENKSAVVTELIRRAIEKRQRRAKNDAALDALIEEVLRLRGQDPPSSDDEIRRIRHEGRP